MSEKPKISIFQPYASAGGNTKKKLGLGDHIERVVKPIARALKLKCLDEKEQLKPQSPCAKRREAANKIGRAIGIGV